MALQRRALRARLWAILTRPEILVLLLALLLFGAWPQIDLQFSALFYNEQHGWFLRDSLWCQLPYHGTRWASMILLSALGLVFATSWLGPGRPARRYHRKSGFLLLALIIGPLLFVNEGLKEHWGRARPRQVQEFHGPRTFSPALRPAAQCDTNCSFVSNHAAMGFSLIAFAWVSPRRRFWLWTGLIVGSAVGLSRIAMGGHFLSDVVFAGLIVWFSARIASLIFVRRRPLLLQLDAVLPRSPWRPLPEPLPP